MEGDAAAQRARQEIVLVHVLANVLDQLIDLLVGNHATMLRKPKRELRRLQRAVDIDDCLAIPTPGQNEIDHARLSRSGFEFLWCRVHPGEVVLTLCDQVNEVSMLRDRPLLNSQRPVGRFTEQFEKQFWIRDAWRCEDELRCES